MLIYQKGKKKKTKKKTKQVEETGADGKDSEADEAILISPTSRQKRSTFLKAVEKVKKDVVLSEKKPEKEFNDKVSDKKPTSSTTTSTSSAPQTAIIDGRVVTTPIVVLSSCTIPGKNVLHIWKRGTLQVICLRFGPTYSRCCSVSCKISSKLSSILWVQLT